MKRFVFVSMLSLFAFSGFVHAKTVQQISTQLDSCLENARYNQIAFDCQKDAIKQFEKQIKTAKQKQAYTKKKVMCNKSNGKPNIEKQSNAEYANALGCYLDSAKAVAKMK